MSNFELSGQTEIDVNTDRDRNTRDTCMFRNQCSYTKFCLVHGRFEGSKMNDTPPGKKYLLLSVNRRLSLDSPCVSHFKLATVEHNMARQNIESK